MCLRNCGVGKYRWQETSTTLQTPLMHVSLREISVHKVSLLNFINKQRGLGSLANEAAGNPGEFVCQTSFLLGFPSKCFLDFKGSRVALCHRVSPSVTHWVYRVWHSLLKFFPQYVFISPGNGN